jgi:hypothetical protein
MGWDFDKNNTWGDEKDGKTTRTAAGRVKGWDVDKNNAWGDEWNGKYMDGRG